MTLATARMIICSKATLSRLCLAVLLSSHLPLRAALGHEPPQVSAAVFADDLPGVNHALARDIAAQVRAAGYAIETIGVAVLTNRSLLSATRYDLLVLPNARSLPLVAAPAIESYLQGGGDLLALGLPAWQSPLFQVNGRWMSRETYEEAVAAQRPQHIVEDFERADVARWRRAAGDPSGKAEYEVAAEARGKVLHVKIAHLSGWETLASPPLQRPFPANHTLTGFRAKGGPHTRQLALEWDEEDGSRWIATVDLTPQWKDYTLLPDRYAPAAPRKRPKKAEPSRRLRESDARFVIDYAPRVLF